MVYWIKYMAVVVDVILFVLQMSCVCSEMSRNINQRSASYSKSRVVNNTVDPSRFLGSIFTSREMNCARACTKNADCKRYLYCSSNSSCNLYQVSGDCIMPDDTTGCSCYTQMIRCEDSECTCPSGKYGEGCEYTISDCITPVKPYSDEHVIPEFNQSVNRWPIGTNLKYSCSPIYYPAVDWTCKTNGIWEEPVCKSVNSCADLNQCNPHYLAGTFIVKYPGTDHDMIVQCFTPSNTTYVRLQPNTTFSYYSTNYSTSCHSSSLSCGYRYFTTFRIYINSNSDVCADDDESLTASTDCDGPNLYRAGKNCHPDCEIPEPGLFQIDLRGTGLKHTSFMINSGQVVYSENEQLLTVTCTKCDYICYAMSSKPFLPANGTDIDYTNTTIPVCKSRS